MPATLTLKSVPDEIYQLLKTTAQAQHRSLNSQAIVCLESALVPAGVSVEQRLAKARALRAALPRGPFKAADIDAYKRHGRQDDRR